MKTQKQRSDEQLVVVGRNNGEMWHQCHLYGAGLKNGVVIGFVFMLCMSEQFFTKAVSSDQPTLLWKILSYVLRYFWSIWFVVLSHIWRNFAETCFVAQFQYFVQTDYSSKSLLLLFKSIYWSKMYSNKQKWTLYILTICTFWFSDFDKCETKTTINYVGKD